jgi:hypothetical protein
LYGYISDEDGIVLVEDDGIAEDDDIILSESHISAQFLNFAVAFSKIFDEQGGFNFEFLGILGSRCLLGDGGGCLCLEEQGAQE